MDKRFASLFLAALIVSGAHYLPSAPPKPLPAAPANTKKNNTNSRKPQPVSSGREPFDTAVRKIHEFLQIDVAKDSAGCVRSRAYAGEFLFATVPDPYNSPHAYIFDSYVESIQRAAVASHYWLDRHWFPWSEEHEPDSDDPQERALQANENQELESAPGLLLFRNRERELLIVFLIAETPTTGINKSAFLNAVKDAQHLLGPPSLSPIRILGPSFSGSITSLKIAMDKTAEQFEGTEPLRFRLVTGAATAIGNKQDIEEPLTSHYTVQYDAVIENDERVISQFIGYLTSQSVRREEVAFVSEFTTVYGVAIDQGVKDQAHSHEANKDEANKERSPQSFQIPNGISLLRNAYQEHPELLVASPKQPPIPGQTLTLTLKDSGKTRDTITRFAPEQTAVTQETALSNIAHAITEQRIKFVGIALTDVLDNLFVAHLLQQQCPNVRLFVLEPDLLYEHTEQGLSFDGLLMASTYPLFTQNQYWTGARGGLVQFANQSAIGVYNAGRVLLSEEAPAELQLIEYSRPLGQASRPPLWLTAVGRDGVWPIALLEHPEEYTRSSLPDLSHPSQQPAPDVHPSASWWIAFLLLTLLCLAHNGLSIYYNQEHETPRRNWLPAFEISSRRRFEQNQSFFLLFATLTLTALYIPVCMLIFGYLHYNRIPWSLGAAVAYILILAVVLTNAWSVRLCLVRFQPFRKTPRKAEFRFDTGATAFMIGIVFWISWLSWQMVFPASNGPIEDLTGLFLVFRSIHLGSGLSPFVPVAFLTAIFYCWGLTHLRRLKLSQTRCPALPEIFPESRTVQGHAVKALDFTYCDWREMSAVSVVFVLTVMLAMPWHSIRSLEKPAFDIFYSVLLITVFGFLLCTGARFLHVWIQLKALLHRLNWHPIGSSVIRLPKDISWLPMLQHGGASQTEVTLALSRSKLALLLDSPRLSADLRQRLQRGAPGRIDTNIQDFLGAESLGRLEPPGDFRSAQVGLRIASSCLVTKVLSRRWSNGSAASLVMAETPPRSEALSSEEEFERTAEEFVALRFVAFIRYVNLQLRNLLGFLSTAFILLVISLNSYPFEPHRKLVMWVTVMFVLLGACILIVFLEMDRDPVLRRLASADAGKLRPTVLLRVLSFGILPLITVLSSQFPSIGRFLFSWVQPALEAVR